MIFLLILFMGKLGWHHGRIRRGHASEYLLIWWSPLRRSTTFLFAELALGSDMGTMLERGDSLLTYASLRNSGLLL